MVTKWKTWLTSLDMRRWLSAGAVFLFAFWLVLWLLGRHFLSDSGFGVWSGAWTQHTSQWLTDPYTFSHLLHGIFLYWLLLLICRRQTPQFRFIAATFIEAGWEILENTPWIIDRYRVATAALDYYGDSILNSTVDVIAALLGFWFAREFNWKWVLVIVVAIEVVLACTVRDNLTLNILMLFHPLESVKQWQLAP